MLTALFAASKSDPRVPALPNRGASDGLVQLSERSALRRKGIEAMPSRDEIEQEALANGAVDIAVRGGRCAGVAVLSHSSQQRVPVLRAGQDALATRLQ